MKTPLSTFVYQVFEKKVSDEEIDLFFKKNIFYVESPEMKKLKELLHGALHMTYPVEEVLNWLEVFYESQDFSEAVIDRRLLHDMLTQVGSGKVALIDALDLVEQLSDKKVVNQLKLFIYENIEGKLSEKESNRLWRLEQLDEKLEKIKN